MAEVDAEAVLNFCDITGSDPDIAKSYLLFADNQLQTAVELFFSNGGAPLTTGETSGTRSRPAPAPQNVVDDDDDFDDDVIPVSNSRPARQEPEPIRAPMRRVVRDTLVGDGTYGSYTSDHGSPYQSGGYMSGYGAGGAGTSAGSGAAIHEAFRDLEAESRPAAASSSRNNGPGRLADMFKPPTDIMFPGDFEGGRARARDSKKWMLVNPQEATEFACQVLNRDLWKDQGVKDFVRENFVFLQFGAPSPEGMKYASFYPFHSYPHIAIIDPRTGERVKEWNTVPSPMDFVQEAMEFLEGNTLDESSKGPNKLKRKNKNVSEMSEEEQILAALEASMAGSKPAPSKTESRAVVNLDEDEEDPILLDEDEVVEESRTGDAFKRIRAVSRPEVPQDGDSTRVQIRLPDGSRLVRRFLKKDPVRHIFEFVKSEVAEAKERPFELNFNKESLINHLESAIEDAGLANANINVAWDD